MWFPSGVESDADSIDALKLENAKLRTQVESLKAIAEQNTSLMWSMQSYQYQVDMTRQQYDKRLKEKDYEVQNFSSSVCYFFQLTQDISLLTENVVVYSNNNYIPWLLFFSCSLYLSVWQYIKYVLDKLYAEQFWKDRFCLTRFRQIQLFAISNRTEWTIY